MKRRPTDADAARVVTAALRARKRRAITAGQAQAIRRGTASRPVPPLAEPDGGRRGD